MKGNRLTLLNPQVKDGFYLAMLGFQMMEGDHCWLIVMPGEHLEGSIQHISDQNKWE